MTIDEAIKLCEEGSKSTWNGHQTTSGKSWHQMAEWLEELKQLREQTRWIPVSEHLPEKAGAYLCSWDWDDNSVGPAYFDKEFCLFNEQVTAWMPLPDPYKSEIPKRREKKKKMKMRKPKTIGEWIYPIKDSCGFDIVIWIAGEDAEPLWKGSIMDFPLRYADLEIEYDAKELNECLPIDFRNNVKEKGENPRPGFVIVVKDTYCN